MASSTMTQIARPARGIPREAVAAAGVAATLAAVLAWLGPPGSDFAAHALPARRSSTDTASRIWNNFWYAGRYSFVTYSLLYYPLAALLGIKLLAVASIATAALAFGVSRSARMGAGGALVEPHPSRSSGPASCSPAPSRSRSASRWRCSRSGRSRRARRWRFALLDRARAGREPCRVPAARRRSWPGSGSRVRRARRAAACRSTTLGRAAAVELVLLRLFPARRPLPVLARRVRGGAACSAGSASCSPGASQRRGVLRWIFVVYLVACTAAYLVPSSLGENIARLRYAAIPIAILTLSLRRWRPLPVAVLALALAVAWNLTPLAGSFVQDERRPGRERAYWAPAVGFLREHLSPSYRVEAVDTVGHWPAVYLPRSRDPDRPRLVPPGRLPSERRCSTRRSTARATSAGCARSACATSCCRTRRSTTAPSEEAALDRERTLRAGRGVPLGAHDDLRRPLAAADRDRARTGRGVRRSASIGSRSPSRGPGAIASPRTGLPTGRRAPAASPAAPTARCC